jgi:thymidine kinase
MKVCIVGNIGCGKSKVLSALGKNHGFRIKLEPVDEWTELLRLYYDDPKRWALTLNLKTLMSYTAHADAEQLVAYERSPECCKNVFFELSKMEMMTPQEIGVYERVYDYVKWTAYHYIYIQTSPEICFDRMKKRGRSCEENVDVNYLQKIHDLYENWILTEFHENPYRVSYVDGDADELSVYQQVIDIIQKLQLI